MEQGIVLETERLLLRAFRRDDADALAAVLGDPITMSFYPSAFDRRGVEEWIERNLARYASDGHGLWAMVPKGSGELIGDCGCAIQEVEGRNELEIGYHVRRDLWRRGYASEAAVACMQYAFEKLGADRVISMIRPENTYSRGVAEKNGLKCEKTIFWHGYEHCVYVMERPITERMLNG